MKDSEVRSTLQDQQIDILRLVRLWYSIQDLLPSLQTYLSPVIILWYEHTQDGYFKNSKGQLKLKTQVTIRICCISVFTDAYSMTNEKHFDRTILLFQQYLVLLKKKEN